MKPGGTKVLHRHFGEGRVTGNPGAPGPVSVIFDRFPGIVYRLPREQLSGFATTPAKQPVHSGGRPSAAAPSTQPSPTQTVEAMRMGVVPRGGLSSYTVGRVEEVRRLRVLFEEGSGLLLATGPYGSGKTHLLELAEEIALDAGFLASRITFDPLEVPPSHPRRVYREVARKLRYPDCQDEGLRPLLERLRGGKQEQDFSPRGAFRHRYLSAALFAVASGHASLADDVIDFVSGSGASNADSVNRNLQGHAYTGPKLYALPDHRTFGQVYSYLLGGIAVYAQRGGYQGLVVLFDEAEFLDNLSTMGRQMAETFLAYMAAATLPDRMLGFDRRRLYRGGQTVHRAIPERFRSHQPLIAVFAFTPLPEVERTLRQIIPDRSLRAAVEPIGRSLVPDLCRRVARLYLSAYPGFTPPKGGLLAIQEHLARHPPGTTRQAVCLIVEALDIFRRQPESADRALDAAVSGGTDLP